MMRNALILCSLLLFWSCESDDPGDNIFTGVSTTYNLTNVDAQYNGGGTVVFKERTDQSVTIEITMQPTGSGGSHPAHLHYGTFDIPDAEMAAMLTPVDATTGISITTLSQLLDGTDITYQDLMLFDGSIKIHQDDGANKAVVLAAVNIGINAGINSQEIAVCSSAKDSI